MPIYTDKVTYGQSNTPSENHFVDGSTPNVLSIKRGTPLAPGAEVLKVNAGVVSFPNQVQTWQNMTGLGGRAVGVDITNSTGQPIQVTVSGSLNAAGANIAMLVGGVQVDIGQVSTINYFTKVSAIVPAGAVYRVNQSGGTLASINWAELR